MVQVIPLILAILQSTLATEVNVTTTSSDGATGTGLTDSKASVLADLHASGTTTTTDAAAGLTSSDASALVTGTDASAAVTGTNASAAVTGTEASAAVTGTESTADVTGTDSTADVTGTDSTESLAGTTSSDETPEASGIIGEGFIDPIKAGGGFNFTFQNQTTKPEPINLIISAISSFGSITGANNTAVFLAPNGLSHYLNALNYSDECGGQHLSTPALAAINDATPRLLDFLYREDFGDLASGSCTESINGGHHFRGWRQNVTGAWFLAASLEKSLDEKHDLVANGYDLSRDEFVRRAKIGGVDSRGCKWKPAKVESRKDLVEKDAGGAEGAYNHDIGIDGVIEVITVKKPHCPSGVTGDEDSSTDEVDRDGITDGSASTDSSKHTGSQKSGQTGEPEPAGDEHAGTTAKSQKKPGTPGFPGNSAGQSTANSFWVLTLVSSVVYALARI